MSDRPSDAYDAITKRRRRILFDVLDSHDWSRTVADLSKALAIRCHDSPIEDIDGEAIEREYLALHHVDVPKLADAGIITRRRPRNTVALTPLGKRLADGNRRVERRRQTLAEAPR